MSPLARRLTKIEARRPAQGLVQMVDANDLDPAVLALWLAVDVDQMNLELLDMLESKPEEDTRMNGRSADGTFANGNAGRPKGARNKATQAVLALLEGEAEALSRKAIEMALAGDSVALRLCLDRIAPPRKDNPVSFPLPHMATAHDAAQAAGAVLEAVAEGELTPAEGAQVMALVDSFRRTLEVTELETRIAALEESK